MKLVHRRKEKTEPPSPVSRAVTPFWPMRRLQSEIDRLFEEPFGSWLAPVGRYGVDHLTSITAYHTLRHLSRGFMSIF